MSVALPAPLSVDPSGTFDGDDGNWSSFTIRIGTPPQDVRVLVSTLIPETWVILPAGCTLNDPSTCPNSRGETFTPSASSTWKDKGTWSLGEEINLAISSDDGGDYGYDTLGFEVAGNTAGGVLLQDQVIAGMLTPDFYVGNLGIAPRKPSFGNNTQPSLLTTLKDQNLIPSLSYGFTAGAYYQNQTDASLTFGGYDASRFVPNGVSFTLGAIDTRDLLVGIQAISFSDSNNHNEPIMPYGTGVLAFIDSTLPNMWLPVNACDAFAQSFGLEFNAVHLYYTLNDTMHEANLKQNASVTFQLGNFVTGGATADITLPYSSFDLSSSALIAGNTTRYFPLRQALDTDQYTLGRAFLQEAFITVDYERGNFSVSQVDFSGKPSHIVAITSVNSTTTSGGTSTASPNPTAITVISSGSSGLGSSAIAGIAIGIIAIAILLAAAFIFVVCRRKRRRRREAEGPSYELPTGDHKSPTNEECYMPNPKTGYGHDVKPSVSTSETQGELEGTVVSSPRSPYSAATLGPAEELPAEELRAELHSPEPPDVPVSPQSGHPRVDLPIQSHHIVHSPDVEANSPTLETASAFQSPRINFTRFGMTTPEPLSPGSGSAVLTPESEKDHFNFISSGSGHS